MRIIDFRYRPSTRPWLDSVIKNPVYSEYIKKTDFLCRPEKSLNECIAELRSLNITKAVVAGRDIESTYEIGSSNDEVARCMHEAGDIFIGFWAFDPHKGMDSILALRSALTVQGFRGAAIDPGMAHCAIDDAKFYPLYAICCEFDVPLVITAGLSPFMPHVVLDDAAPGRIDRVATDFPSLKMLVSHGGYPYVTETIAVVMRHDNIFMDFSTCPSKLMGEAYIKAANEYITDKVVFASANPFVEVAKAVRTFKNLDLTDECRKHLFYENAEKLLRIGSA